MYEPTDLNNPVGMGQADLTGQPLNWTGILVGLVALGVVFWIAPKKGKA